MLNKNQRKHPIYFTVLLLRATHLDQMGHLHSGHLAEALIQSGSNNDSGLEDNNFRVVFGSQFILSDLQPFIHSQSSSLGRHLHNTLSQEEPGFKLAISRSQGNPLRLGGALIYIFSPSRPSFGWSSIQSCKNVKRRSEKGASPEQFAYSSCIELKVKSSLRLPMVNTVVQTGITFFITGLSAYTKCINLPFMVERELWTSRCFASPVLHRLLDYRYISQSWSLG